MTDKKQPSTRSYREMLALKGMGVELQKMEYPRISNLTNMLETLGYTVTKLSLTTNTPSEEDGENNFKY